MQSAMYFGHALGKSPLVVLTPNSDNMKIMIVDDHPAIRRIVRWIIDSSFDQKNEIIECEDGAEAVVQFGQFHPDVVLMDIQLQEMNGFEVTEKIYRQNPNVKIVFVTSHDTPAFRKRAQELHAHGFISKDNLTDLSKIIQ